MGLGAGTLRSKAGEPIRKPVTLDSIRTNLPILNKQQRSSMRSMILALPTLPTVTLDVEAVGKRDDVSPWNPRFRIEPSEACVIRTELELYRLNGIEPDGWQLRPYTSEAWQVALMNKGGEFEPLTIADGKYRYKVIRVGVQNDGIVLLERTLEFLAREKSHPENPSPPPQSAKSDLTLQVVNQSGSHFTIMGVVWILWQQTFGGFGAPIQVSGESVKVRLSVEGQYHINVSVTVRRNATGDTELADFRGNSRGPNNVPTLVIIWPGDSQSRGLSLLAEGSGGDLFNPVVVVTA